MWVRKADIQKILGCKNCKNWCYKNETFELKWCIKNGDYLHHDNTPVGDDKA